jgi:hypothetical protein
LSRVRLQTDVTADGFMTIVQSPTPTRVSDKSLALIPDGDQQACDEAVASLLSPPLPESLDFTVAVPGFTPTTVQFRRAGTAAAALLLRPPAGAGAQPELHSIAFVFPGVSRDDELEVIRRIAGGHDSTGRLYPIPPSIYDQLRTERARPLLTLVPWRAGNRQRPIHAPHRAVDRAERVRTAVIRDQHSCDGTIGVPLRLLDEAPALGVRAAASTAGCVRRRR